MLLSLFFFFIFCILLLYLVQTEFLQLRSFFILFFVFPRSQFILRHFLMMLLTE